MDSPAVLPNDTPVQFQVVSYQTVNFAKRFGHVNYEDRNFNSVLPVFSIHGTKMTWLACQAESSQAWFLEEPLAERLLKRKVNYEFLFWSHERHLTVSSSPFHVLVTLSVI